jgi:hypothetical protein
VAGSLDVGGQKGGRAKSQITASVQHTTESGSAAERVLLSEFSTVDSSVTTKR